MNDLRTAAQQALEALYQAREFTELYDTEHAAAVNERCHENITALRAALAQRDEPVAYTTGHCENHKQKGGCQLHNLQCGWPDCDRKPTTASSQQAEPAQVAERERIAAQWDGCVTHQLDAFGPVNIGASIRAGELVEAQQAEPVPGAWVASPDGRVIYDDVSADDGLLRVSGDFENDEQRIRYAQQIVDKLNAAPPQRKLVPLTEEEIYHATGHCGVSKYTAINIARVIEEASWEKNHGQA